MNKFLALTLSAFFYSVILCAHTEKCDAENATFDGKVDAKQLVFPEVSFVDMAAKVGSYIEFTLYITTDAGAQDVVRRDGEAGEVTINNDLHDFWVRKAKPAQRK